MTNMCVDDFNRRFYGESNASYAVGDYDMQHVVHRNQEKLGESVASYAVDEYDMQHVGHLNQEKLESLKSIRENINWEIGEERDRFIWKVFDLLSDCEGPIPDLRDILEQDEIDWILAESSINRHGYYEHATNQFITYVVNTSCNKKVEPDVDRVYRPPLCCPAPKHDTTKCDFFKVSNDRIDANCTDAFDLPPFHAACMSGHVNVVETFLELGQDPNCLAQKTDATPLSLALSHGHRDAVELLLRRGADPNQTDEAGSSYLHVICEKEYDIDLAMILLVISSDMNRPVKVNAQDKKGRTPLHLALSRGYNDLAALLLISGADPNLADLEGSTPLHAICKGDRDDGELVKMFFEINEDIQRMVQVNALDKFGRTPLHLALYSGHTSLIKFLLTYGVSLDLADAEGTTPLHIFCRKKYDDDLMKMFFDTTEAEGQSVLIDARDKKGRTPLQWAVASLLPSTVDRLLDRGADLSRFIFPTKWHFNECAEANESTSSSGSFRLTLTAGAMGVVERLEKRGYELDQNDATTIMKLFSKYGVFKKSVEDVDDEEFATKAKMITVNADLSLYDLIQLPFGEATKRFTPDDCLEFAESNQMWLLLQTRHAQACARHLCKMVSRKFFLSWTLEFFCKLTHYRLLAECSEMVLENLANDDLWHICLAGLRYC
ncbi:unnamed protein product [Trichogramma brassicae]|uniref:Uncharacterized protein n=1 Tax=Trichogramma brassicae TaxID=86971 RepID=A0A6H5J531_9HYME|nr:unnamed protein product [Trichogramma brassicae]